MKNLIRTLSLLVLSTAWGDADVVKLTLNAPRPNVSDFIYVAINPPDLSFAVPAGTFLCFDARVAPGSASDYFGFDLSRTRHCVNSMIVNLGADKGQWHSQRVDLSAGAGRRVDEVCALGGFHGSRQGGTTVEYRDIRLTDRDGKVLRDLTPRPGSVLAYPLDTVALYAKNIRIEAKGVIGGRFVPARYLCATDMPCDGKIILHNFDPEATRKIDYALTVDGQERSKGSVELSPDETRTIPVTIGKLTEGHHVPTLALNGKELREYMITALSPKELGLRRTALRDGTAAMGVIQQTGLDSNSGLWNLPRLREQGCNFIQLRVLWGLVENESGQYDFSFLKPMLDMAESCGLGVRIEFMTGSRDSIPQRYRQDSMVSNKGPLKEGAFLAIPYRGPTADAARRAMVALAAATKGHPAVVSYAAWNAGGGDAFYNAKSNQDFVLLDYSASARRSFQRYLEKSRNLTLPQVNQRDGTRYASFDEIELPQPSERCPDLRPVWFDFMNFRSHEVEEGQRQSSAMLNRVQPDMNPSSFYGGGVDQLGKIGNDFDVARRVIAANGGCFHQTALPGSNTQMYLGTARRELDIPYTLETGGTPADVPTHQYGMFEILREGATGYTWIQAGGIKNGPGPDYGCFEYRHALDRLNKAKADGPALAVVYNYTQQMLDPFLNNPQLRDSHREQSKIMAMLEAGGYDVDAFTDRTREVDWKKYPVVFELGGRALDSNFVAEITAYVENGGTLLMFPESGKYSPGSQKQYALAESLHIPKQKTGTFRVGKGNVQVLAPAPCRLNGNPGRKVDNNWCSASFPNEITRALEPLGVQPRLMISGDNIYGALRRRGNSWYTTLFNYTPTYNRAVCSFSLPKGKYHRYDLIERKSLSDSDSGRLELELEPYGISVVEWSSEPIEPPVDDAPVRCRTLPPPPDSIFGESLSKCFDKPTESVAMDGWAYPFARVERGHKMVPPVQVAGKYRMTLALAATRCDTLRVENTIFSRTLDAGLPVFVAEILLAPDAPLAVPEGDYAYMTIVPVTRPLDAVTVSPALHLKGNWNGPEFHAPLPSSVEGKTLRGVNGVFDLARHFGMNNSFCDLSFTLTTDVPRGILLVCGADYGLRLSVNGADVFDSSHRKRGAPVSCEFAIPVKLERGDNKVVARVTGGADSWNFQCELLDSGTSLPVATKQ